MSYYQPPVNSGGYQSQQYPSGGGGGTQGYYGYPHQQQGQYGGGAGRYPPSGGYHPPAPTYSPGPQMNKSQNPSNPFLNSKQPAAGGYQYQNNSGYGSDNSYYMQQTQKNYTTPTRSQNHPASYSYYPASAPSNAGYLYGYTGTQQTPSTASTPTDANITPLQQQAIKNWIVEKHKPEMTRGGAVRGGGFNRGGGTTRFSSSSVGPFTARGNKRTFPRESQQLANYYCEVCKVSCGTSETYHTHLNGKSHKKKQANPLPTVPSTGKLFKCDVCDILCTGKDAFNAHIVGTKHKKVVKLHERMGKPIPEIKNAPVGVNDIPGVGAHLKKTGKPLIKFVKSSKELNTTGNDDVEDVNEVNMEDDETESPEQVTPSGGKKKKKRIIKSPRPPVKPLSTGIEGFTDAFGVPLHHISSKDVFVTSPRLDQWRYSHEEIERFYIETSLRRNRYDDFAILDVHRKVYPTEKELESLYGTLEDVERVLNVISDKLHKEKIEELKESLKATETEEQKVEETSAEGANVEIRSEEVGGDGSKEENEKSDSFVVQEKVDSKDTMSSSITQEQEDAIRIIQGFQRVGDAAKGLNLNGNLQAELVVMCSDKPTEHLLKRIVEMFPGIFTEVTKFAYQVTPRPDLAGFQVFYTQDEISCCVLVTLTSLEMRECPPEEDNKAEESKGVLDPSSCQRALCQMRRTKWFQGQAFSLPSYVLTLRVLKDVSRRVPAWTCLDNWILELLLQKVASKSHPEYTRPGDIIRGFIACIASGCFLPGAPGILDPCEKDKIDASTQLTSQQREDLTFSAQHALRLISFKQLHKVLGLENAPKMQDIQSAIMPPRMPIRRYVPYRNFSRAKKRVASTPESEKKPKVEESANES